MEQNLRKELVVRATVLGVKTGCRELAMEDCACEVLPALCFTQLLIILHDLELIPGIN